MKAKSKEEIAKEKKLNNSLVLFSKRNREQLGIVSAQPEKNIISLEGGKFVKIYSLKGVELTDIRRNVLIMELCRFSKYRMRLSTFYYANSDFPIIFLTVFFDSNSYAEIADEIDEFDSSLSTLMNNKFKISFLSCSIGDVFMFVYMNYNGQMKKVSSKSVMRKSVNLKKNYYREIKEQGIGCYILGTGNVGKSYIGIQFPEKMDIPLNSLKSLGCTYLSCIDFQVIDKDYSAYYDKMIEDLYYGASIESKGNMLFNFSFMITLLCKDEKSQALCDMSIKDYFEKNNLIVAPCVGMEKEVFESISSFGIKDLHCCRNVSMDIVAKLFG